MATTRCTAVLAGCAAALLSLGGTWTATAAPAAPHDPARGTLPRHDGWASLGPGTTGGAAADAAHTYTVTTWQGLTEALAGDGDAPRLIRIKGTLDATGSGCAAFAAPGYDFDRYLAAYSPGTWGMDRDLSDEPDDSQEGLRRASAAAQGARIKAYVPGDTTIVGVGAHAGITGGSLQIKGVDNVVIRNLTVESPLDCFPQWDPTDGDTGNWNSEYDGMVVDGSTHVWIDHNTFTDGAHPDSSLPSYYGRVYQRHDGELDVVKGADLITASWNVFADHDKTLLIGNSDGAGATDRGRLRVTLHHNLFRDVVERAPRVRFGRVDAYNNHYAATTDGYGYSLGIGAESQLVAEKNAFTLPEGVSAAKTLKKWSDAPLTADGNHVNGAPVDLIAVHNAEMPDEALRSGAGWTPVLRTGVDSARAVPGVVGRGAGAGRLR